MHSHYSPGGRADRSHRCSLATLNRYVRRRSFRQSVTTTLRAGRDFGTRECSNVKHLRLRDTALSTLIRYLLRLRCCTTQRLCYTLFQRLTLLSGTSLFPNLTWKSFTSSLHSYVASEHRCYIDYTRCAVRRGTNSIPPMTAAAALLSSFVRAV